MQSITNEVVKLATEAIVILLGSFGSVVLVKFKHYLDGLKKKDQLGIINEVTDQVVEYAEAELSGAKGIEKRNFALKKAVEILASKGIPVNETEILAGIENGVNKLKMRQAHAQSVTANIMATESLQGTITTPQADAVQPQPEVAQQPTQTSDPQ